MSPDRRRALGALGERAAEDHLVRAGYRIVSRNFRTRFGELDLVAANRSFLVFCEVKTRVAGGRAGPDGPLEAIGTRKRRRLRRMAAEWLGSPEARLGGGRGSSLRFDAIGVTVTPAGGLLSVEHLEDAF